ncbi:PadR family transcriptional regulator [Acholeplasma laidlawii]|jgi:PadR family transcriptional regulator PadR|uniref:Transcriptional regulator, PadR family n=2 Tax=Acholeplasma laidlawii TaxID=2148 RepID=A9NE13_ACHLI|nr:PadR family transcriptional regulator [Acholeplasma laidlawii]ABX81973.1 transcriptional regulator, PadR family [Acholeplasma laidlawii PG-8A]NWH10954.1 PadR family transcriptional regulator [Acholeplasma laidlawii]NWH12340.1 PadR family transcriptional regulator [Acholeplasma laidlawii]NWH13726.1 PadR family transcriptional regulator [Acholeplasma laidlawii]NWH15234.1 PadR family transcriptional regulator [Acholeplasma laidlawii]
MPVDLKKHVIELFVLALLTKGPSYGYKLVSDLNEYVQMSESTLYPVLRRLEKDGRLSTYNEIYQGRNRKYYKITMSGKRYIDSYLEEWKDIKKIYDIIMG